MADGQGIRWVQDPDGSVTVTCGADDLARLWALIAAEVCPVGGAPPAVTRVVIRPAPVVPTMAPPAYAWIDRAGMLGCAATVGAVLLLLGVGAYTVSKWLWG